VRLAKKMVLTELDSMGFSNSQIKVAQPTADGFICHASLNTPRGKVDIELPIEIKNNIPLIPSVFASGDYVADFNSKNLKSFVSNTDNKGFANGFELYSMDLSDLKQLISKAAIDENFSLCDEILDVISARVDDETYRLVVADYVNILNKAKTNKELIRTASESKSDEFYVSPNSMYPIHKKLGLPLNELVQDESGEFHRKSSYFVRESENAEGAFFSTAKVLVGD
jgi:hypothetical protein